MEDEREATVPLRVGILAGTAVGSVVLGVLLPVLVFFEALLGLIALAAGGTIGAGPSRTPSKEHTAGTIISLGIGLLAGPVFYLVAWAVDRLFG